MGDREMADAAGQLLRTMCGGHAIAHVNEIGFGLRTPVPRALDTKVSRALVKDLTEGLGQHIPFAFGGLFTLANEGHADKARAFFTELVRAIHVAADAIGEAADE